MSESFTEVIENISRALAEMDGDQLAKINNEICDKQVTYAGDGLFEPAGMSTDIAQRLS